MLRFTPRLRKLRRFAAGIMPRRPRPLNATQKRKCTLRREFNYAGNDTMLLIARKYFLGGAHSIPETLAATRLAPRRQI
jgi:hypothetical protein